MSVQAMANQMRNAAAGLRNPRGLVKSAALVFSEHVKSNIDRGRVAGKYRPAADMSGNPPGAPMETLSDYTIQARRLDGIFHDDPLRATGQMQHETGYYDLQEMSAKIGGRTDRAQRLLHMHLGTGSTGLESTDLRREIPPRNPIGYDEATLDRVKKLLATKLGGGGRIPVRVRVVWTARIKAL